MNKDMVEWVYSQLVLRRGGEGKVACYMLEEIIDDKQDFSVPEYHEYCRGNVAVKTVYEKTRDLLHIRIIAAPIPEGIKWRLLAALYPESYVVKKGGEDVAGHDEFVMEV